MSDFFGLIAYFFFYIYSRIYSLIIILVANLQILKWWYWFGEKLKKNCYFLGVYNEKVFWMFNGFYYIF